MLILSLIFILFCLVLATISVVRRHKTLYLQGKITRGVFLRNTVLEILGILLAMTLAGLLGKYLAQVATAQISHSLIRVVLGILIGMLVGVCIESLMKRFWGYLVKL